MAHYRINPHLGDMMLFFFLPNWLVQISIMNANHTSSDLKTPL